MIETYSVVAERPVGIDAMAISVRKYVYDPDHTEDAKAFALRFGLDGEPVWTEYQRFERLPHTLVIDAMLEMVLKDKLTRVLEDANRQAYEQTANIIERLRHIVTVWDENR